MIANKEFKNHTIPVINERSINSTTKRFGDLYLSYNPSSRGYGCNTTAIVLKDRVFFVINGDHRSALWDAADKEDMQGCIDYFIENISQANAISEHHMAVGLAEDPFSLAETTLAVIGQDNVDRICQADKALSASKGISIKK